MSVPSWYELLLFALAAYRLWRLLAWDEITEPARLWITRYSQGPKKPYRATLGTFIQCGFCLGFWVALAWWGAWQAWPHATLIAAAPFAISALVGTLARLDG